MKMSVQVSSRHSLPLALLAGGLATRLRPVTEKIPKSMMEIAGEPFIAHQLRLLAKQQVRDIVICAGYLGEQIAEYVGDGGQFGCHVTYSFDGDKLLGTGGAIRKAIPLLGDTFFVMYGDSYLPTDFAQVYDVFANSGMSGLMTVFKNDNQWDTSNVLFAKGSIAQYDKRAPNDSMQYIDYGLGILTAKAFSDRHECERFDLAEVYESLVASKQLAGFEVHERFFEIGSWNGLDETNSLFLKLRQELDFKSTSA